MEQVADNRQVSETMKPKEVTHKYHNMNPFIDQLAIHIQEKQYRKTVGSKYQQVVDEGTGEVSQQKILILGEKKVVDRQEFYKVFMGEIKSFFNLSNTTMKLFDYIMNQIEYSKDRICLYQADVMDKLKISRTTCYRSTVQLLDAQIIAKADTEGCYFVNPTIAFKGDRIALWREYQVREKTEVNNNKQIVQGGWKHGLNEETGETI